MAKKKAASSPRKKPVPAIAPVLLDHQQMQMELRARAAALLRQRRMAESVFERHRDRLLARPEVTGIHVGLKKRQHKFVSPLEYCIRVHVSNKLERDDTRLHCPIESQIEGVGTDVLERVYDTGMAGIPQDRFVAKLAGGIPIAREGSPNDFGSLGVVLLLGDEPVYLTNKHVVGQALHKSILQPPSGHTPAGQDAVIGEVVDFDDTNGIDAAIIKATGNRKIGGGIIDANDRVLNAPLEAGFVTEADNNKTKCLKIGAVTGDPHNLGIIQSTNASISVNGRRMDNQIVIEGTNVMKPGDSGSLVLVPKVIGGRDVLMIVGLAHAVASDGAIVACHFHRVVSRFGLDVS